MALYAFGVLPHGLPKFRTYKSEWMTSLVSDIPFMSDDSLIMLKETSRFKKVRAVAVAELAFRKLEMGWQRAPLDVSGVMDASDREPLFDVIFTDDFVPYGSDNMK